eukprot:tig00000381_g24545.t1
MTYSSGGSYRSASMAACLPVPEKAVALTGSANYTTCLAGHVPNGARSECVACAAGTYDKAGVCERCTYRSAGMLACMAVPARSVAQTAATNYTMCAPGSVPNDARSECVACRKGTREADGVCERCPLNTVTSLDGQRDCTACEAGYVAAADSQTCTPCATGSYRSASMAACLPVPEKAVALAGSANYTTCLAGHVPNGARSECVACAAGTYDKAGVCERCPLNSIAPTAGSATCTACQAGYAAADDAQSCQPCMAGTYRSAGMLACTAVPARSVAQTAATNYTMCAPGSVPNDARSECVACRKGTREADGVCERCPLNTVTSLDGQRDCTACEAGYVAAADSQTCTPCAAGSYRSASMAACLPVPEKAVALTGSANYTTCLAGHVPNGARDIRQGGGLREVSVELDRAF